MLATDLGIQAGPRRFLEAERARLASISYQRIELRPLSPTIGAEVHGVDLGKLDDEAFDEIRRAHLDYKVLFFRDQAIDTEQHVELARRFGELEVHPFLPHVEGFPEVICFAKDEETVGVENIWHSDVTWREEPSLGSVLRAREVPAVGGDTLFSDMVAAYEGLDEPVQEQIEGRKAVHDFTQSFGFLLSKEELARKQAEYPAVEHPVVRTHPETGRKGIYVNAIFTSHIVGMEAEESRRLLEHLCRQASTPEYQCRFRWDVDSIAFWDNRAVQHYASSDYWPQQRVMERVTVVGDRPR
ncbi:MAG: TauD/TfdA family dioxygenase [Myxococcota bacterium]